VFRESTTRFLLPRDEIERFYETHGNSRHISHQDQFQEQHWPQFHEKKAKNTCRKTGIPLPNKGSFGAHGFRHRALTDLKEKGVCDFETRLAFRHETATAHNMYPESELKMREQKYTTHILNSKIALLTMKKLTGDGDEEDDFIESKVLNAPTEVKALPGTMLGKLFSSEGKPQQALRSFIQPAPIEELKAQELLEKKQVVMPP
jgi:hypothetical protein